MLVWGVFMCVTWNCAFTYLGCMLAIVTILPCCVTCFLHVRSYFADSECSCLWLATIDSALHILPVGISACLLSVFLLAYQLYSFLCPFFIHLWLSLIKWKVVAKMIKLCCTCSLWHLAPLFIVSRGQLVNKSTFIPDVFVSIQRVHFTTLCHDVGNNQSHHDKCTHWLLLRTLLLWV